MGNDAQELEEDRAYARGVRAGWTCAVRYLNDIGVLNRDVEFVPCGESRDKGICNLGTFHEGYHFDTEQGRRWRPTQKGT